MHASYLLFNLASYSASLSWGLLGLITISSIIHNKSTLLTNTIIGVLFVLVGVYIYAKKKATQKLLKIVTAATTQATTPTIKHFMLMETLIIAISALVGIVLLWGAARRMFVEQLSIFDG